MKTAHVKQDTFRIALVGNPNCGKTSLFNILTGLNQKTGNYPGITVSIAEGHLTSDIEIFDLPGAYSLHAKAEDEFILTNVLLDLDNVRYPDIVVYVIDVTNLEKQFLLFTQIQDLKIPAIMVLNMMDLASQNKVEIDVPALKILLGGTEIFPISSRTGEGIKKLKERLIELSAHKDQVKADKVTYFDPAALEKEAIHWMQNRFAYKNAYQSLLCMHHSAYIRHHDVDEKQEMTTWKQEHQFNSLRLQIDDTLHRFDQFSLPLKKINQKKAKAITKTDLIDQVLTHRWIGPVIFILTMILVFQAIYAWATYPMDWIETIMGYLSVSIANRLPSGWITSLVTDGLLPGIAGVIVFVPQIAILFFLVSLLEEVGYMSRAVFMFDHLMQKFGLNGRSLISLISGGACAIPAIMASRTISNPKERLLTMLVTPFISCSARIPVYAVLVAFVVPPVMVGGFLNAQGLVFAGLYFTGILAALLAATILKKIIKSRGSSYLMISLPEYKVPNWRNVGLTVWESISSFIIQAGKVILVISLVLWLLSSYGPPGSMAKALNEAQSFAQTQGMDEQTKANYLSATKLENSYAGQLGHLIEPVIAPMGFDWKIGIALLTSFAAREVFVGTMATIYSLGSTEDEIKIRDRLAAEINPDTGAPRYSIATSLSLLLFYALAMQCMSTMAVMRKETGTWKWPIIQFIGMTGLAYLLATLTYQFLA